MTIAKALTRLLGKTHNEKKLQLSGEQALKKYPEIILIPTRYLGVSFCLREVS